VHYFGFSGLFMRPKLLRPTVELFISPPPLSSVELYRAGAFGRQPMIFPFKAPRLRAYSDRIEIYFRDRNRPPQTVWLEWRPLHLGGAFPYFICYQCRRRCILLYPVGVDHWCRRCGQLQFRSQAQTRKARLKTKAENIRARLWTESGKLIRPYNMHRRTYRKYLDTLHLIDKAIRTGVHISSPRYQRFRERDSDGRYCESELQGNLGDET
jgi:hypothetical protein